MVYKSLLAFPQTFPLLFITEPLLYDPYSFQHVCANGVNLMHLIFLSSETMDVQI